jgi:hypothetical protein
MIDSSDSYYAHPGQSALSAHELRIDPHILWPASEQTPDREALILASLRTYKGGSSEAIKARSRELRRLKVAEADASMLEACPGILVPTTDHSGCPKQPTMIGLVGPTDSLSTASPVIQVLIFRADSLGKIALLLRYTMAWRAGGWTLVEQTPPVVVE